MPRKKRARQEKKATVIVRPLPKDNFYTRVLKKPIAFMPGSKRSER